MSEQGVVEAQLYYSVCDDDAVTVERLLRQSAGVKVNRLFWGANTGVCSRSRWCLLHICCEKGRYDCAKLLLEAGT